MKEVSLCCPQGGNGTGFLESMTRAGLAVGVAQSATGLMGRGVFQESGFPFPSSSPPEREDKVSRVQRIGQIWLEEL